jgi:putative ABC transport system ATP-binding protein
MIRCEDVHKSYRGSGEATPALRGVDLSIDEPGFFAVMGPSGSGKSTLLHLLAALDRPDRGVIEVAGARIDDKGERELTRFRRREIGIVFQQFNLIPTMSAIENVELPGLLAGEPGAALRERATGLLDRLGLAGKERRRPEALSGGEQQRVAIARALLFAPRVVFADEPTGALDSRASERLWALLAELSEEERMLVLMVTHEPAAAAHCRRAYVLRDGRMTDTIETEGLDAGDLASEYQRVSAA